MSLNVKSGLFQHLITFEAIEPNLKKKQAVVESAQIRPACYGVIIALH